MLDLNSHYSLFESLSAVKMYRNKKEKETMIVFAHFR